VSRCLAREARRPRLGAVPGVTGFL
jgi:hypothetical protein